MKLKADLHIHSCLSPCADLLISPRAIAKTAKAAGLDAIALTDHNSALNCQAFAAVCKAEGIIPFFGLEVSTAEAIHVLGIFQDLPQAVNLNELVSSRQRKQEELPVRMGEQLIVNEAEEVEYHPWYLGAETDITLAELAELIHKRNGLMIPSHINRPHNSLISQLGRIPTGQAFDAVEIDKRTVFNGDPLPAVEYPLIANSDSHHLETIGSIYTEYDVAEPTIEGIRQALRERKTRIGTSSPLLSQSK